MEPGQEAASNGQQALYALKPAINWIYRRLETINNTFLWATGKCIFPLFLYVKLDLSAFV
jgi:hypothetical protein